MIAKLFGLLKHPVPLERAKQPYGDYSSLFSSPPQIATERLLLRPLDPVDATGLFELDSDEEICRLSLTTPLNSLTEAESRVEQFRSWGDRGYPVLLAVVAKETSQFLGTCGVTHVDPQNQTLRLGFSYTRSSWNQGYGTEALQALCQFLMTNTDVYRLECHCFPENMASRRVMEKTGMSYEGILREAQVSVFGRHDCCVYSLLRKEYQGGSGAFS